MKKFKEIIKEKAHNKIYENFDKYFDNILKGAKYLICAISIVFVAKGLISYPLKMADKYYIELNGQEYVELYKNYGPVLLGVIIISVLAIPVGNVIQKIKSVSKDGVHFGDNDEPQDTRNILNKTEVQADAIRDLINSNDDKVWDEKSEEDLYNRVLRNKDDSYNMLKCKNIKSNMKPLTMIITRELYNNYRGNITKEIAAELVKNFGNRKKKKQEKNKIIAHNIIEFLINNDIIESDDIESEKYYFTQLGNIFMNYFQNGII